jgi:hypothetical protein
MEAGVKVTALRFLGTIHDSFENTRAWMIYGIKNPE